MRRTPGESGAGWLFGFRGGQSARSSTSSTPFSIRRPLAISREDHSTCWSWRRRRQNDGGRIYTREDWEGIERLLASLQPVRARRVVLISTIDVLPPFAGVDESFEPHGHENHAYGANRLRLEDAIKGQFAETHVVRLPSLFGPGLKKNVIYDLLHGNQLDKINPESSFQYYDLGCLWEHISLILREGIPLIHLFPEPLTTAGMIDRLFAGMAIGGDAGAASHYAFKTRYASLFGGSDGYIWPRKKCIAHQPVRYAYRNGTIG